MTIEYMICFCVYLKKIKAIIKTFWFKELYVHVCVYVCVCTHIFPVGDIRLWKTDNKSHKIILLGFQLIYKHVIYWELKNIYIETQFTDILFSR